MFSYVVYCYYVLLMFYLYEHEQTRKSLTSPRAPPLRTLRTQKKEISQYLFTLSLIYPRILGNFLVDNCQCSTSFQKIKEISIVYETRFVIDSFQQPWGFEHVIRLLKCRTLRSGSPSDHLGKQYNQKDYMSSSLDQVIRGTYVDISHGRWGRRKALWPHLHLTRWWVDAFGMPSVRQG